MPIGRQGGAIVVQNEPNTFLAGVGEGLSKGFGAGMAEKKELEELEREILIGTAAGKYDPRIWNSEPGRAFLKSAKLDSRPGIKGLIAAGEAAMPQPSGTQGENMILPGGSAVNRPQPDMKYMETGVPEGGYPSAKEVTDLIFNEETGKRMAIEQKQQDIMLGRQIAYYAAQDQLRRLGRIDPVMMMQDVQHGMKAQGLNPDDYTVNVNDKGQVTITAREETDTEKTAQTDKHLTRLNNYNTHVGEVKTKKSSHQYRLNQILSRDVAFEEMAVEEGVSAPVAKALNDAISALSKSTSKSKILDRAQSVTSLLKSVNEEIEAYNNRNMREGLAVGIPKEQLEADKAKPLTFEDVSGGLSLQDWIQRQKPAKDGDKMISSLREEVSVTSVPGRPAASSSERDADKIKTVYDGIKDIVADSRAANPSLTSTAIRDNIMALKGDIMSEYGLNEKLFSYVMTLVDKAFA